MTNNITSINQKNEFENLLKKDAEKLNNEVSTKLREQLFDQLSTQAIKEKTLNHSSHTFIKNKLAIAASFIFAVFIIQFFVAQQPVEESIIVSNNSEHDFNELLLVFSSELKHKELLASQDLNNEYKAILADMEKVRKRIVTL